MYSILLHVEEVAAEGDVIYLFEDTEFLKILKIHAINNFAM